jgi:hypothetical protein
LTSWTGSKVTSWTVFTAVSKLKLPETALSMSLTTAVTNILDDDFLSSVFDQFLPQGEGEVVPAVQTAQATDPAGRALACAFIGSVAEQLFHPMSVSTVYCPMKGTLFCLHELDVAACRLQLQRARLELHEEQQAI